MRGQPGWLAGSMSKPLPCWPSWRRTSRLSSCPLIGLRRSDGNYDETAPVGPLGVYAETKAVRSKSYSQIRSTRLFACPERRHLPTGDRGFNEQMRRAWQAGQTLRLFTDEFRSPIAAEATARAIWELVTLTSQAFITLPVASGCRAGKSANSSPRAGHS